MRAAMIKILPFAGIVAGRVLLTSDPQYGSAPSPKGYSPSTASGSTSVDLVASASSVAAPSGTSALHQREADLGPRGPYSNGSATARDLVTSLSEVLTVKPPQNGDQPHEFVSVDLAPRDAVSSNGSSLERRARETIDQVSLARIGQEVAAAARWIPWMFSETVAPHAPRSEYWHLNDPRKYGWSLKGIRPPRLAGLRVLQGLVTVEGFEVPGTDGSRLNFNTYVQLNAVDWLRIKSEHDTPWVEEVASDKQDDKKKKGHSQKVKTKKVTHPPTKGDYEGVYSQKHRVVAWTGDFVHWSQFMPRGTQHLGDMAIPPLRDWSDIAFLDYVFPTMPHHKRALNPPAWFYLKLDKPSGPEAKNVKWCLQQFGIEDLPVWPNTITFPIGSQCYNALLGTQLLRNVVWFLLKRKELIRNGVVASITVWTDADPEEGTEPEYQFLLHVRRHSWNLQNNMELNAAFEKQQKHGFMPHDKWGKFASKKGPFWPKPMRPLVVNKGGEPIRGAELPLRLFNVAAQPAAHANDPGVGSSTGHAAAAPAPAGGSGSQPGAGTANNTTPEPPYTDPGAPGGFSPDSGPNSPGYDPEMYDD